MYKFNKFFIPCTIFSGMYYISIIARTIIALNRIGTTSVVNFTNGKFPVTVVAIAGQQNKIIF